MCYGQLTSAFVYFYIYISLKDTFDHGTNTNTFLTSFCSAGLAEIAAILIYYPFELIKTRMQTKRNYY